MASQPACAPSCPETPDEGGKAKVPLPPVSSGDLERPPHELPCAAPVKAYGRLKLSMLEARQGRPLAPVDSLGLTRASPPPEEEPTPERKFWGDQETLSKIPFKIMKGHQHIVTSCNFCVDDTKLLSGSYDCTVKLWDAVDGSVVRDFEHRPKAPVLDCSVTADSRRFVTASHDKAVRAWDLETGKLLTIVNSVSKNISRRVSVQVPTFSSFGLGADLRIRWAHSSAISNCCFTVSGHFLCTSSWDKTLKIWNVHTGEFRNSGACVTLMQGHEGSVSSCHFSRDTSFLVSGGFDRTVAIWDVGEGYRKLSLKGHSDWVTDVAISNNKKWVLSASKVNVANLRDRTVRLWNIEEIDQIPMVIKYKKALGLKVKQCEVCEKPFSTYESDIFSETVTKCVFCRMSEDLSAEALSAEALSSSSGGEDIRSRECSLGTDD
ncbi:WD repeat-containing protein 88 isoform X3 [Canis lupus familiaris]|uniref:WD repeat-containing protein 88 isoform X3 n=1 Tax=Canis lupus familiaris TaxID=9615 RepID=UPI0018F554D9|nr:WD repeat-containing protein 88 isoform X3 [Canis lupus familiaris]XP_038513511.1 WD repeat-containing protein 88 isoform X3 [Canis lupus familiaris]